MKIVVYKNETLAEGAALALKHRLYVPAWQLCGALSTAKYRGESFILRAMPDAEETYKLSIAFVDGEPVAVVLWNGSFVMAYCTPAHRRNGYASACLKALNLRKPAAYPGIKHASVPFWHKNEVRVL